MGGVYRDEHLLPRGIVQAAANEHALPFVQQARVKIQLSIDQFKNIKRRAFADGEQPVRQGRPETELYVVSLVPGSVYQNVRAPV